MSGGNIDLFGHAISPGTARRPSHRRGVPDFSLTEWQRLMDACPIEHGGCVHKGDFLACANVSTTQFSIARLAGGCKIGGWLFVYIGKHDLIVRVDFHAWAMQNWASVLGNRDGRGGDQ